MDSGVRREDRTHFRLAYGAWLFGFFAFFLPSATWNPVSRFNLTRAIVEHGELRVDEWATSTGDRALVNGHWFSDKPPIVAFAAVPVYALVHAVQRVRHTPPRFEALGTPTHPAVRVIPNKAFQQGLYACSLVTSAASGVAVGLLLFELLRRRTTSRVAFLSTTFTVLGTPLFPYSTSFYSHVPAAALLLGAIYCLDQRGVRPEGTLPTRKRLRVAGLCLALAPGCEYLTAVPAAVIGLWFLLRVPSRHRLRVALELGAGAAIPALVLCAYHTAVFGAPWRTGYSFETGAEFVAGHASGFLGIQLPHAVGAYGLLLSVERGLFYISPLSVFGLMFGFAHARRRKDFAIGAGLVALAVLYWLNASYYMWWGGAAAGPRHLIPGLPFLAAGVMVGLRARWAWVRTLTVVLALISMANFLALTAVGMEAPEHGNVLWKFAWHHLQWGNVGGPAGSSNLGLRLGLKGGSSILPLLAWAVLGFGYLLAQLRRGSAAVRWRRAD
jgi:hypothetical protein